MSFFRRTSPVVPKIRAATTILDEQVRTNLLTPLPAVTNLWDSLENNPSQMIEALLKEQYASDLLGNQGALTQQSALAVGTIGVMPSQWGQMLSLGQIDTGKLALGMLWDVVSTSGLADFIQEQLVELGMMILKSILGGVEQLLGGIPVIGWAVDIILGLVRVITAMVQASNVSDLVPPQYCRPPRADIGSDEALSRRFLDQMQTWDWSSMFSPAGWQIGTMGSYQPSLEIGCCPIENTDSYVMKTSVWTQARGHGVVPGSGDIKSGPWIHETLIFGTGSWPMTDTGDWLPQSRTVAGQAWCYLFNGPTMFCADASELASRWRTYLGLLIERASACVPNGKYWFNDGKGQKGWRRNMVSPQDASRRRGALLDRFGLTTEKLAKLGLTPEAVFSSGSARDIAIEASDPVRGSKVLHDRQRTFVRRPVVAYVDTPKMPAGKWKDAVVAAQKGLLTHFPTVCALDLASIPDDVYRAQVEMARTESDGKQCKFAGPGNFAPVGLETEPFDPNAPNVPPMPNWPDSVPSGSSLVPHLKKLGVKVGTQTPKSQPRDDTWKLITIGTLGVAAGGTYLWMKKTDRLPRRR